jgi:hypothetical protein
VKRTFRFSTIALLGGLSLAILGLARPARADLSAGLVGYYQMASGKVNDASGHFNNGRSVNVFPGPDRLNNAGAAFAFLGMANTYVRVDSNSDLNFGTGDFSFSLWMKHPAQPGTGTNASVIFQRSGNTSTPFAGLLAMADAVAGHVLFRDAEGDELMSLASGLSDNTWRHYAFVRENKVLKLYINGTLDSFRSAGTVDVSTPAGAHLYLGANAATQVNNLLGSLDELRIYNRALSAAEISVLANASPVNCGTPTNNISLQAGRFTVRATWSNGGTPAEAFVSCGATTDQTAYFYWTDPGNSELIVKLLDFCAISSTWSVYANGATDMNVNITITDNVTHATWTGLNLLGQGFQLIRAGAFPCN